MRRLAPAALLLTLACTRDLAVPPQNTLALSASLTALAPREAAQLAASGGRAPYTFGFAPGGQLSGADAAVDGSTGLYQAGADGSVQDQLQVSDASGTTAALRITVGQRLTVSPAVTVVAPGGSVPLVVSGGKQPYQFQLDTGATSDATFDDPSRTYLTGMAGGFVDRVVVGDATADAAARVTVEIHVGARLQIYPDRVSVAPNERVTFLGFGGESTLYAFALGVQGSGGGTTLPQVDPLTGEYVAGSNDAPAATSTTDTVVVTDGNGRTATATITVGRPLVLPGPPSDVRPGGTIRLTALGGKPPYLYGFAEKGNRTGGRVDAAAGDYTPGNNVGASDILQVTDATGTAALATTEPRVGAVRAFPGLDVGSCTPHALSVNYGKDAILVSRNTGAAVDYSVQPDGTLLERDYVSSPGGAATGDPDGDLVAEFVGLVPFSGLKVSDMDITGTFSFVGTVQPTDGGTSVMAMTKTREIFVDSSCAAAPAGLDRYTWGWSGGLPAFTPACEAVPSPATNAILDGILPMAVGDLDGNGTDDVAFVSNQDLANVYFWYRGGTPSVKKLAIAGASFVTNDLLEAFRMVPLPGGSRFGLLVLLRETASNRMKVWMATHDSTSGNPAWTSWSPLDPDPSGPAPAGVVSYAATDAASPLYLAWNGVDGTVAGFDANGTIRPGVLPAKAGFPVTCVAPARTLNFTLTDLWLGSRWAAAAELYPGDGDGGFGRRARFAVEAPLAIGDVDGDGLDDVVSATGTPGVKVLFGTEHQLAQGEETAVSTPPSQIVVGRLDGTGRDSVVYQDRLGNFFAMASATDGRLIPPSGTLDVREPGGAAFTTPISSPIIAFDLGGEAPGDDLWVQYSSSAANPVDLFSRISPTQAVHVHATWPCGTDQILPIAGAGGADAGAVAICEEGGGPLQANFYFNPLSGTGSARAFGGWQLIAGASKPSTTNMTILAAGNADASARRRGNAWFVVRRTDPSTGVGTWIVQVAPGNPPTVTWTLATGLAAVSSAYAAQLDGANGPDFVVQSGRALATVLSQANGSFTTTGTFTGIPGIVTDLGRFGSSTSWDPLVTTYGYKMDQWRRLFPIPVTGGVIQ